MGRHESWSGIPKQCKDEAHCGEAKKQALANTIERQKTVHEKHNAEKKAEQDRQ